MAKLIACKQTSIPASGSADYNTQYSFGYKKENSPPKITANINGCKCILFNIGKKRDFLFISNPKNLGLSRFWELNWKGKSCLIKQMQHETW